MANKLVSVDSSLNLPAAVQAQLQANLAAGFATNVSDAQTAAGSAVTSATNAHNSEVNAAASAASAAAPTDAMVASLIPGTSSTRTALDGVYTHITDLTTEATARGNADTIITESLFISQETAPAHKVGLRWYKPSTKATSISDGTTWNRAQQSFVFGSTTPVAGVTVMFSGNFTTNASGITQAFDLSPYMSAVYDGFGATPGAGAALNAIPQVITLTAFTFKVWNATSVIASQTFPGMAVFHGVA